MGFCQRHDYSLLSKVSSVYICRFLQSVLSINFTSFDLLLLSLLLHYTNTGYVHYTNTGYGGRGPNFINHGNGFYNVF